MTSIHYKVFNMPFCVSCIWLEFSTILTPLIVNIYDCVTLVADRGGDSECLYSNDVVLPLWVPECTCLHMLWFVATFSRFETL